MRTLLLGHRSAEQIRLQNLLVRNGHEVELCHDGDWGCVGLNGRCPLDDLDVDVAVAVAEPGVAFDAQGVTCVHRARIPLVTFGARSHDSVMPYATVNAIRVDEAALDVLAVAARDASGYLRAVEEIVEAHRLPDEQVGVSATRGRRQIDIVLTGAVSSSRGSALADLARQAVRTYDPRVAVINISVEQN